MSFQYTVECTLRNGGGVYIAVRNYDLPIYFYRIGEHTATSYGVQRTIGIGAAIDPYGLAYFNIRGICPKVKNDQMMLFALKIIHNKLSGYMFNNIGEQEENPIAIKTESYGEDYDLLEYLTNICGLTEDQIENYNVDTDDHIKLQISNEKHMIASIFSEQSAWNADIVKLVGAEDLHKIGNDRKSQLETYKFDAAEIQMMSGNIFTLKDTAQNNGLSVLVKQIKQHHLKKLLLLSNFAITGKCGAFPLIFAFGSVEMRDKKMVYKQQFFPLDVNANRFTFVITDALDKQQVFAENMDVLIRAQQIEKILFAVYCMNFYLAINFSGNKTQVKELDNGAQNLLLDVVSHGSYTTDISKIPGFPIQSRKEYKSLYKSSIGTFCVWLSFFHLLREETSVNDVMTYQKYIKDGMQRLDTQYNTPAIISDNPTNTNLFNVLFVHQNDEITMKASSQMKKNVKEGYDTIQKLVDHKIAVVSLYILEKSDIDVIKSEEYDVIFYFVTNKLITLTDTLVTEKTFIINMKEYKKSWRHTLVGHDIRDAYNKKPYKQRTIDYWCKAKDDCEEATNNKSVIESIGSILQKTALAKQSMSTLKKAAFGAILIAFAGIVKCHLGFGGDCTTFLAGSAAIVMTALFGSKVFGYVRAAGNKLWGKIVGDDHEFGPE